MSSLPLNVEEALRSRYTEAAQRPIAELCCPARYDKSLLEAIPREVQELDYGCGNPAQYLRDGDAVLDLGSGSGKIAFIASQIVGPAGRVIAVDMNDRMLAVARAAVPEVARRVGYSNVAVRKGRIQDLALDLEGMDEHLRARAPYREHVELVEPSDAVPVEAARPFPCADEPLVRHPRETKGDGYRATKGGPICRPDGTCC